MAVSQSHSQYERQAATLPPEALSSLRLAQSVVQSELLKPLPDLAKVSIVLGAIEGPLTVKDANLQRWPVDLQVRKLPRNLLCSGDSTYIIERQIYADMQLQAEIGEANQHLEEFLADVQAHLQKSQCTDTRVGSNSDTFDN